ncbi:hypothetical protein BR93DRAFT_536278 [Coniochaeta sp. PMI_546]|nr:hypothetical protein BR93DRAFT_536278 [Coniochaeta sp. PMI_546]
MEDEPGQDVVAISHTAWGVNKRPASPLDIDAHTSKRSWSSITRHKATGQPLVTARDRGHDSHLRNAASRWDSGGFHGDPALGSAATNNSLSYQHQSFNGRAAPTGVGLTGTWDQYLLPGHDECGFDPVLHFRPDVNHYPVSVGGPLSHISQSQSPTTALTGLGLPLPSVNRSFPPGPLPTSAQSQTPPYTPYTPYNSEISGSDNAYLPTDMRVPTSPTGGQKQYRGSYPEVHQARDHFTVHSPSSVPLHRLTQYDQVLAVGSTDYAQQPSRTVPGVEGYPAVLPRSLNTFHEFSNGPGSAAITHDYAAPVIGSDSSDAAFGGSLRQGPMSAHPTGLEHDSWSDHDSLTIRLAVTQQYEQQQTQNLGRYIEVLHPLDEPYNAQDGDTTYSDVEETIIADDDEVGAKMQTMRSLASSTNSVDDPYPYSSSSNSSYINLSSPSSIQQDGAEHACYSRNDSITESMGTEDFTIVPRNSSLPDKKPRKKRGEFERDKLEETNKTRLMKACVACRKQKIRQIMIPQPPV